MTDQHGVAVFFYGGYMNFDVLAGFGIGERAYHVVQVPGCRLTIGASANVVKSGLDTVFGIVTWLMHDELEALYGAEAQARLGAVYIPEAVLTLTRDGDMRPALCYIAADSVDGVPTDAYLETILRAARDYVFPQWYVQHIESYRGDGESSEA